MKVRISIALAVVAVLIASLAGVASAASQFNLTGTLTSFSYNAKAKTGKLHIISSKGVKTTVTLNAKTNCGVSFGQSGDQIKCSTLSASKYHGKPVNLTAKKYSDGHYTASLVSADQSK
jgi:hypothetical protein